MKHRLAIAALAAGVITVAACADRDGGARLATEPGDSKPVVSYVTTGAAAYVDPRTHRLTPVTASAPVPNGVSASIAGAQTGDALVVSKSEPGIALTTGKAVFKYADAAKHQHEIVLLYRSTGGPPAAMQHYTDGVLVSTTSYAWAKTSSGWVRAQSLMRSLRNGVLVGTYTTSTNVAPSKPGGGGGPIETVMLDRGRTVTPLQKAVGAAAYGLAFAFAPEEVHAQLAIAQCLQEWLRFANASLLVVAASTAMASAPALTPILISAYISALAALASAEDALLDCVLANQRFVFSGSGVGGGGGGGGAGGGGGDKWDCFEGSYAAHCTTPFTL